MQSQLFDEIKPSHFPSTRYQGSKRKLLPQLSEIFSRYEFSNALDLFSGSGSVSYLLRSLNKIVTSNDYLAYNANTAQTLLSSYSIEELISTKKLFAQLLNEKPVKELTLVRDNYQNIFFTDQENQEIDFFCANLSNVNDKLRAPLIYAVGQALLKKRPYNLFHRANLGMRMSDVKRSFGNKATWDTPIEKHAIKAIDELLKLQLDTLPIGSTLQLNTNLLEKFPTDIDLIYLDPPYIPKKGKTVDYCDFYCFLDGLIDYDLFSNGSDTANHKPILKLETAWATPSNAIDELQSIVKKWTNSVIIFSYRGDGAISPAEIEAVFTEANRSAKSEIISDYKYALAHSEDSSEIVVLSDPS